MSQKIGEQMVMSERFAPGAGVLSIHLPDRYDFESRVLEDAVKSSIPVGSSFGRMYPQYSWRSRVLVYSSIRRALASLYAAWNERTGDKLKVPVVTNRFMETWCESFGQTPNGLLSELGVAMPCDTIDLGITRLGGRKLVITTFGVQSREYIKRLQEKVHVKSDLLRRLTDIVILGALGQLNRTVIYHQLCDACGWVKQHTEEHTLSTSLCGIDLHSWELYDHEVRVGDGEPFLYPYKKDSWLVCQAGTGETNRAIPWEVVKDDDGEVPAKVRNRIDTKVSVTCMPIERCWCAEYN